MYLYILSSIDMGLSACWINYSLLIDVQFLPISGLLGSNMKTRVDKKECSWWDGPCLFEALDAIEVPPRDPNGPFRYMVVLLLLLLLFFKIFYFFSLLPILSLAEYIYIFYLWSCISCCLWDHTSLKACHLMNINIFFSWH